MSDTNLINDFVLKPLMLKNASNTSNSSSKTIIKENGKTIIRKKKKYDLSNYILNSLMPQNAVKKVQNFDSIISSINSGNCALFVDTLNICFNIDVKGFKQRSIDSPNNEVVIKGPQAAFVENIRTNTSLLRQFVNSENLIIENIQIGNISKTNCAVCYMKNITNSDLVAEVKFRLNNLKIDFLLSSGELEQLIVEDTNLKPPFANFLKAIRGISVLITFLKSISEFELPFIWGGFIAVTLPSVISIFSKYKFHFVVGKVSALTFKQKHIIKIKTIIKIKILFFINKTLLLIIFFY